MKKNIIIIFIILIQFIYAQPFGGFESDSAYYCSFFPMHVGDKWFYRTYYFDGEDYYFHYQIVKDTLDKSNNKWFGWKRSDSDRIEYYSITDSFEVVYGFPDSSQNLLIKLNALPGDKWLIYGNYESGIVYEVDTIYDYGSSKVMKIDEWGWDNYEKSLWYSSRFLETNLGLIQVWWEVGPPTVLVGSIIDGVIWGNPDLVEQEDPSIIKDFTLFQNYPNPFNLKTVIPFYINSEFNVVLRIYNILGKLVYSNENHFNKGYNSFIWEGINERNLFLSSGIYICKISTDESIETIKIILNK